MLRRMTERILEVVVDCLKTVSHWLQRISFFRLPLQRSDSGKPPKISTTGFIWLL